MGIISPWELRADIPNIAATHALAVGDAIVQKPASTTPFSVINLAEVYEEAGFPPGFVNVVTGPGKTVGAELVRNPGTNAIHFTGETTTGEYLTQIAGVKRLLLELGGNGPLVVMDDANIDQAVEAAIVGLFYLAGQALHRLGARPRPRGCARPVRREASGATRNLRVRDPLDETTDMGPLNNLANVQKVQEHIDDARARGGEFVCGGTIEGLYCQPTIVDGVTSEFLMARDETFRPGGPDHDVLHDRRGHRDRQRYPYGLQGAAFTSNLRTAWLLGEGIKCGTVHINDTNNTWNSSRPSAAARRAAWAASSRTT